MKIKSFFTLVVFLFSGFFWTQILSGAIPSNCPVKGSSWYKKAAAWGSSKNRTICINSQHKKVEWYDTKKGKLLGDLDFSNINQNFSNPNHKKDPDYPKGIWVKPGSKETLINIPMIKKERGRKTLVLFCKGSCTSRAESFKTQLNSAMSGKEVSSHSSSKPKVSSSSSAKKLKTQVTKIQATVRMYLQKKKYKQAQAEAAKIEKIAKQKLAKKEFDQANEAATILQAAVRGQQARKEFKKLQDSAAAIKAAAKKKLTTTLTVVKAASKFKKGKGKSSSAASASTVPEPPVGIAPPSGSPSTVKKKKVKVTGARGDLLADIRNKDAKKAGFNKKAAKKQATANKAAAAKAKKEAKEASDAQIAAIGAQHKVKKGSGVKKSLKDEIEAGKKLKKVSSKSQGNKLTKTLKNFINSESADAKFKILKLRASTAGDQSEELLNSFKRGKKAETIFNYISPLKKLIKTYKKSSDKNKKQVAQWLLSGLENDGYESDDGWESD